MVLLPGTEAATNDRRAKSALKARLARRYQLQSQIIRCGDLEISITGVADPDQVLLEMERGIQAAGVEAPRWQPYWAQSWESALALGHVLATRELLGKNVLDLGCGLGMAGTVAAARGARVLLADAAHPSLLFARYNAWPWRERVRTQRIDWREDTLDERFDFILGADIVYDVSDWPHLEAFWKRHLAPSGAVWLAEPSRDHADELPAFLQARGWSITTRTFPVANRKRPIRMISAVVSVICDGD